MTSYKELDSLKSLYKKGDQNIIITFRGDPTTVMHSFKKGIKKESMTVSHGGPATISCQCDKHIYFAGQDIELPGHKEYFKTKSRYLDESLRASVDFNDLLSPQNITKNDGWAVTIVTDKREIIGGSQ